MDSSLLRPYQVGDAEGMLTSLEEHGAALNAGDVGVGKSYSIMAVARELGVAPVIVCPKSIITVWERIATLFEGKAYVINYEKLTRAKTEFGKMNVPQGITEARAQVRNLTREIDAFYEVEGILIGTVQAASEEELKAVQEKYPIGWYKETIFKLAEWKATLKQLKRERKFKWDSQIPLVVFDEGHRCKEKGSLNAQLLIAAKNQDIRIIVASATAAKDPMEMWALGYVLGLHTIANFYQWVRTFGCVYGEHGGLLFLGGQPALKRLHGEIFPTRGVRLLRESIPDFPATQITAELYHLPEADEINALYKDLEEQLGVLDAKREKDRDLEHILTQILRDRQRIEMLKVPLFVELAEDAQAEGMSVVVFINFEATLHEICKRLKTSCFVDGSQKGEKGDKERQANIDKFNSGESTLIIVNIKAGGVGLSLHDLDGRFPRVAYISPTYSGVDLIQVLGRVWRNGGKSKSLQRIVLVKDTVEESIHKQLQKSLNNISLINDGDLRPILS